MKGIVTDCRHAVRLYLRTPGSSLIAITILAIGTAFVGALLSLYVDLTLKPEPAFERSRQIATVGQNGGPLLLGLPIEVVDRMSDEMNSIDAVAMVHKNVVSIGLDRVPGVAAMVSSDFFEGLRPRLALGRGIRPDENQPGAEPVTVISYATWQQQFGGDPDVIGKELELSHDPRFGIMAPSDTGVATRIFPEVAGTLFRIIGVMPANLPSVLSDDLTGGEVDSWIAFETGFPLFVGTPETRRLITSPAYVRKRSGVSAAAVNDEITSRYSDYEFLASNYYPDVRFDAIDGIVDDITVKRNTERQLEIFFLGSILLALVAAGNASLFLLARAPARRRELSVRMSVGATPGRIARQLATEATLLVIVAAAFGLLISVWLSSHFQSLEIFREANWRDVTLLDWRVMSLIGIFILVMALLVSLTPLVGFRRQNLGAAGQHISARASPIQRLTGSVQLAAAGALSGAAIAFAWYFGGLLLGNAGYEISDRYVVQFTGADMQTGLGLESYSADLDRHRATIEAIPGVDAVGFGRPIPGVTSPVINLVRVDRPDNAGVSIGASTGVINPEFLEALGLELVHGRAPSINDPLNQNGGASLSIRHSHGLYGVARMSSGST